MWTRLIREIPPERWKRIGIELIYYSHRVDLYNFQSTHFCNSPGISRFKQYIKGSHDRFPDKIFPFELCFSLATIHRFFFLCEPRRHCEGGSTNLVNFHPTFINLRYEKNDVKRVNVRPSASENGEEQYRARIVCHRGNFSTTPKCGSPRRRLYRICYPDVLGNRRVRGQQNEWNY